MFARLSPRVLIRFGAILALLPLTHAHATPRFVGINNTNTVNFDIGATSASVAGTTGVDNLSDLDADGSGQFFAVRRVPGGSNESYRINPASGAATLVNNNLQGVFFSLAFRPADGHFYSVNQQDGRLGTLDLASGVFSSPYSGPHNGLFRLDGLAFAPSGALYGMYNSNPTNPNFPPLYQLVQFDLSTGLSTAIGNVNDNHSFRSLRFDAAGNAYTIDFDNGDVYGIDLTTGHGTVLYAGGIGGVNGLALVPEPAALLLLASAMLVSRRRSR